MLPQKDVEFPAIDGIILRGRLYPAPEKGPGIVLCPGFNCVKDMLGLPEVAEKFQQAGITALIYDPRSTGLSDGIPRNDIDPVKQIEDYSDALTYINRLPTVDSKQTGFWGMSFAGAVALCAASLDKRAKFVIAICPMVEFQYTPEKLPMLLAKCMRDRESQVQGNAPFCLPMLTESGINPAGFGIGMDKEEYTAILHTGKELAPNYVNRTTIQSYYKLLMWQPTMLWQHLNPKPVFFIVPELDMLCSPDVQKHHFERFSGPKRLQVELGKGHMDILQGEHLPGLMSIQTQFIRDVVDGRFQNTS